MAIAPRRVNFTLYVTGTTDRNILDWADGVAKTVQDMLNENNEDGPWPADIVVEVTDLGEGG